MRGSAGLLFTGILAGMLHGGAPPAGAPAQDRAPTQDGAPAQDPAPAKRPLRLETREGRPVFLAAPAVWDGMFVHWYFVRFTGSSPFGSTGSGVDLRSYWMGKHGTEWSDTGKRNIVNRLGLTGLPHTHHAGEDAAELALIFQTLLTTE